MSRKKNRQLPWAELSLAYDLYDRVRLPLPRVGDPRRRAARWWRYERINISVRRMILLAIVLSVAVGLSGILLTETLTSPQLLSSDRASVIQNAFAAFLGGSLFIMIGLLLTQILLGLCLSPYRLRTRRLMLLHAERLRLQGHSHPPVAMPLTRQQTVDRLGASSLHQELLAPLIFVAIGMTVGILAAFPPGRSNLPYAALSAPLFLIVVLIIFVVLTNRGINSLARRLMHAASHGTCPICAYQVVTAADTSPRRCPECGLRSPALRPANQSPSAATFWRRLGARFARTQ